MTLGLCLARSFGLFEARPNEFRSFGNLRGSQEIRVVRVAACAGRCWEWAACSGAGIEVDVSG